MTTFVLVGMGITLMLWVSVMVYRLTTGDW